MVGGTQEAGEDGGVGAESPVSVCRRWSPEVVFTLHSSSPPPCLHLANFLPVLLRLALRTSCRSQERALDTLTLGCVWCTGSVSGGISICAQVCSVEWHWLPLFDSDEALSDGCVLKWSWNFRKGIMGSGLVILLWYGIFRMGPSLLFWIRN